MKKKKLFASLTALCVAVCAMVVGIYAAASANVSVNGIISYTALGNVKASLELSHALTPADKASFKAGSGNITATKTVNNAATTGTENGTNGSESGMKNIASDGNNISTKTVNSGSQTGAENVTDGTATTAAKININGAETDVTGDFALGNIEIEAAQGFADAISYAYTLKIINNYTAEELAENKGLKISFTQPTATNLGITYQSGYTWTDLKSGETVIGKTAILAAGAVATIVVTFSTSADVSGAANLASSIALEAVSASGESVSGGETEKDYTVKTYAAAERPVQELTNIQTDGTGTATNWYEHYIEMGEYPQTYYGATLPKAESEYTITSDYYINMQGDYSDSREIKSTLYEDKTNGAKFAKQGANFYNVEPVKWIVMGVTDGVLNGTSVLFTTNNKTAGLWQYNSGTNTFQYRTNSANVWTTATEVLVLSEYGLMRGQFHPDYNQNGRFANSAIRNTLNTTLYNSLFTDNQKTKISPKKMEITTFYYSNNSIADAGVAYNLFLLGTNWSYNGSSWGLHSTDSYNISTYFTPANKDWGGQGNIIAKETSYSAGSTVNSPNGYGASCWWLRSGGSDYGGSAMYGDADGYVSGHYVSNSFALRPAFVLDLTAGNEGGGSGESGGETEKSYSIHKYVYADETGEKNYATQNASGASLTHFPYQKTENENYVYYIRMGSYTENTVNYDVDWIVLGGSTQENYNENYADGANSVLFTDAKAALWSYSETEGFKIGNTSVKSLLLISQCYLGKAVWNQNLQADGNNFYATWTGADYDELEPSDINKTLNKMLLPAIFDTSQQSKVRTTIIDKTTYCNQRNDAPSIFNNGAAQFFLLGGEPTYYYPPQLEDSFKISQYFGSAAATQFDGNREVYSITDKTSTYSYWLRSGHCDYKDSAMGIFANGGVTYDSYYYELGLRPAFVLNAA